MSTSDKNIVIVTNAQCLLDCKLGSVINSFKDVVRLNDYCIDNFHEDLGNRTTIWSRSDIVMDDDPKRSVLRKIWYVPNVKRHQVCPPRDVEIIPSRIEKNIHSEGYPMSFPTTGFITLLYLLEQYTTLHVCGWYKQGSRENFNSYIHKDVIPSISEYHAIDYEKFYYQKLVKQGRLIEIDILPILV